MLTASGRKVFVCVRARSLRPGRETKRFFNNARMQSRRRYRSRSPFAALFFYVSTTFFAVFMTLWLQLLVHFALFHLHFITWWLCLFANSSSSSNNFHILFYDIGNGHCTVGQMLSFAVGLNCLAFAPLCARIVHSQLPCKWLHRGFFLVHKVLGKLMFVAMFSFRITYESDNCLRCWAFSSSTTFGKVALHSSSEGSVAKFRETSCFRCPRSHWNRS